MCGPPDSRRTRRRCSLEEGGGSRKVLALPFAYLRRVNALVVEVVSNYERWVGSMNSMEERKIIYDEVIMTGRSKE